MDLVGAVISVLKRYAEFSGRSRRSEFWYYLLFVILVSGMLLYYAESVPICRIVDTIFCLAVLVPTAAVCVRRLHDTGRKGLLALLFLIPVLGQLLMAVWLSKPSQKGTNAYGPDPTENGPRDYGVDFERITKTQKK